MPIVRPVKITKRSHGKRLQISAPELTIPVPLRVTFEPDVRGVYNTKRCTLVDSEGGDFEYSEENKGREGQYVLFDFEPGGGADTQIEDPWMMRFIFLQQNENESEYPSLDGITLVYGRFGRGSKDLLVPAEKVPGKCHALVALAAFRDEFLEWVSLIGVAMETPMGKWETLKKHFPIRKVDLLRSPMPFTIEWQDGRPTGFIRCSGVLEALIATLQIDELIGAEYRFCACEGCRNTFEVKRQDQRYCSETCKHKQVVRDGRNRARRAEKKRIGGSK